MRRRAVARVSLRAALRGVTVVLAMIVTGLAVAPPWAARAGVAQPGVAQAGVAQAGVAQAGVAQPHIAWADAEPIGGGAAPRVARHVPPPPPPIAPPRGAPAEPGPAGPVAPPPRPPGAGVPAPGARYSWPLSPVPVVTGAFRKPTFRYGRGHRGADLAGVPGQAVLAVRDGVVVFAGPVAGRGVVSVDHPDGLRSTYEPVTAAVVAGAPIAAGDPLGVLDPGHAGCPVAACLHWGVRRDRLDHLDPLVLLRPPRMRLLPWEGAPP